MNRYLAGAIGGVVGTLPMTAVMEILFRRLPPNQRYPLPPREVTMALAYRSGLAGRLRERARFGASLAAHFGYGMATGALYPLVARRRPRSIALHGSLYGVAIWALSYFGWIAALGILATPNHHPPQRRRLMIAAHLIWGAATALVAFRLADGAAAADGTAERQPAAVLLKGFHERRRDRQAS